jgi:hypothetical protein
MKKFLTFAAIAVCVLFLPGVLTAQCTPGDETTCPDPENNGQICPDSLPKAIIDEPYSQQFTILAPPSFEISGLVINLHHIKILGIENLPSGITWLSNAADSVFMVGTYYCVLLEGTPSQKGIFPLKIQVGVWLDPGFGLPPIAADTIADSTSLSIEVIEASSIGDRATTNGLHFNCTPNPFNDMMEIELIHAEPGDAILELYSLTGQLVRKQQLQVNKEHERISMEGEGLLPGMYLLKLYNGSGVYTRRIIRAN